MGDYDKMIRDTEEEVKTFRNVAISISVVVCIILVIAIRILV